MDDTAKEFISLGIIAFILGGVFMLYELHFLRHDAPAGIPNVFMFSKFASRIGR
jgi:hypothetical protein